MTAVAQALIALLGVLAVALALSRDDRVRRYAPFVGMASQPFWLWETWGKWGMFSVCVLYTFVWAKGIADHVRRDRQTQAGPS